MSDTNDVFILTLKIKDEFETYLLSHNVSVLLRHHCQVQNKYKNTYFTKPCSMRGIGTFDCGVSNGNTRTSIKYVY